MSYVKTASTPGPDVLLNPRLPAYTSCIYIKPGILLSVSLPH